MKALRRTAPEVQQVHSASIKALIDRLDGIGNEVHGFMIARNDCVIAESWLKPYAADIPHACHSLGKSYTCTAVGVACAEGLMTPDDRFVDLFQEEIDRLSITPAPSMQKVRIRDLMTMSSGTEGMPTFDDHFLENFLASPMAFEPGEHFYYNTTGSCVLGAAVEKAVGTDLLQYLRPRLLEPIGIGEKDLIWQQFVSGVYAEPGVCATTEANLRLGLFYLHEGAANGQQIVDREWIRQATSKQIETSDHPGKDDGSCGYGWQLWLGRVPGLYRFDGGQGQLCFVYPQKQCVVALHQAGRDPFGVARSIELVQAFMRDLPDAGVSLDPAGSRSLRHFLQRRALPKAPTAPLPAQPKEMDGMYHVTDGEINPWFEVVPVDADFWHYFYDPAVSAKVQTMAIRTEANGVRIRFNGISEIFARLDGIYETRDTKAVLPGLTKTCAVAIFLPDGGLQVDLRWLNGWSRSIITIRRSSVPGNIEVMITKDMLHDMIAPISYHATARLVGL